MSALPLKISPDLALPIDAVTQTFAILAKRGAGKSFTSDVIAEEMLRAGQQVVILDPTGAHWGLRSSADGKTAGYPIVVFGGDHADLPLEEHSGETIADALCEHRFPAILDLSLLRKGQTIRFAAAFLETLYRKNRQSLHLIVDEADTFAPQRLMGEEARMCGAMEDVVKKGRIRGLGCTLITQRPAVLNKNVLTQCESLFAMRLTHPKDIDAIREWVAVHATPEEERQVVGELPSLAIGTAWFWSPGWLGTLKRVAIRRKETFDSGATPKPGEKRLVPKAIAQVDLAQLGEKIKETAEQVKQSDPKTLRAKIADLTSQLAKAAKTSPTTPPKAIEKPVLTGKELDRAEKVVQSVQKALKSFSEMVGELTAAFEKVSQPSQPGLGESKRPNVNQTPRLVNRPAAKAVESPQTVNNPRPSINCNATIGKGEMTVLTAVAQHQAGVSLDQLTVLTGYKRSSRNTYLQRLRSAGLIEQAGNGISVTAEGLQVLGDDFEPLPSGAALQEYWLGKLPEGERRILELLIASHPDAVDKDSLSESTGYKRSSRNTYLQRLRSRKLIVDFGSSIAVSELLFG